MCLLACLARWLAGSFSVLLIRWLAGWLACRLPGFAGCLALWLSLCSCWGCSAGGTGWGMAGWLGLLSARDGWLGFLACWLSVFASLLGLLALAGWLAGALR